VNVSPLPPGEGRVRAVANTNPKRKRGTGTRAEDPALRSALGNAQGNGTPQFPHRPNGPTIPMHSENLFAAIPAHLPAELFTTLHRAAGLRIERIVSQGHASPDGFWYDQDEDEWVVLLEGSATIRFADDPEPVELTRGSYLHIAAHRKHRVARTSATEKTIWLAIHSK
jgi:cupin 2 domain-containing protein